MAISNPEYNYQTAFFEIRTLSNLHAGSGSENYGVIDNLIQRDTATGFPCILASSLKGALREYFRHYISIKDRDDIIPYIFGNRKSNNDLADEGIPAMEEAANDAAEKIVKPQAGAYRFLQADLISIPARSDVQPYHNATSPWLLNNLQLQLNQFGKKFDSDWISQLIMSGNKNENKGVHFEAGNVTLETEEISITSIAKPDNLEDAKKCLGNDIAILKDEHFVELVSDFHLPVIARNNLEDGRSTNLWYEQVLPRETRLVFEVLYPSDDAANYFQQFKEAIESKPVQIGANASVGYGFCEIREISTKNIK